MSFWRIAWKNMQQRGLASSLTALSMALGVAVMTCVIVIHSVAVRQFSQDAQGYHLIVGGKGGSLQLVLSTVYHLGQPLYPIPYSSYRQFVEGRYANVTETAVPYCLGDSFDPSSEPENPSGRLFRVVATTPDLFDKIEFGTHSDGSPRRYTFSSGRNFHADRAFEAVLGSVVAAQSGIEAGDTIHPTHGISGKGDEHDAFLVTGILDSTGTANDRAVFVNIEGFYLLEGHALSQKKSLSGFPPAVLGSAIAKSSGAGVGDTIKPESAGTVAEEMAEETLQAFSVIGVLNSINETADKAIFAPMEGHTLPAKPANKATANKTISSESPKGILPPAVLYDNQGNTITPLPEAQREVTSILVLCNSSFGPMTLLTKINKDASQSAQAVAPAGVVASLLERIVGPLQLVLLVLTILIVVVASISILVSIYNSMNERSHDIAVMRALGASRASVMLIVLTESVLLSLAGGLLGIFLGHTLIALASPYVESQAGVRLAFWEFDLWEIAVIPALVALAALAGLLPAVSAYRTDVAKSLAGVR